MLHCTYHETDGELIADGKCEEYANELIGKCFSDEIHNIVVTNFLVIDFLRLAIKEGRLNKGDIHFHNYKNELILSDNNGHLNQWPEKFGEIRINVLMKIM